METFSSRPFTVKKDIDTIFGYLSNPSTLSEILSRHADKLSLSEVRLTEDSFAFDAPMAGTVKFVKNGVDAPYFVSYKAEKSPLPIALQLHLKPSGEHTDVQISVDANVPVFLKGMISGRLTPVLEKIATMMEQIDFDRL